MELESTPVEHGTNEDTAPLPFSASRWGRILYGLFVMVMPPLAFWATELFKPEWQNGQLDAYLSLLLSPVASLLFFPLLAYSVICYLVLLAKPDHDSPSFALKTGIYTGTLLAFQYSILAGLLFSDGPAFFLVWLIPFVVPPIYRLLVKKWDVQLVNSALTLLTLAIYLISAVITRSLLSPLLLVLAGLTLASPFWIFLMFLRASIWLYRKKYAVSLSLPAGLGIVAWFTTYVVAWRYDILKMYELYAALPPQPPPDCYIATAAARGHPQLVRSWVVDRETEVSLLVNRQLQVLKSSELALMAVTPRLHKILRKLYDVAGKLLARGIQNRFLADIAYVLLKPWEWLARFLLKLIIPEIDLIIKSFYTR